MDMQLVYDDIIYSLQKSGGGSVYWTEVIRPSLDEAEHYIYDSSDQNIFCRQLSIAHRHLLSSRFLFIKRFINPRYKIDRPFLFHSSYFRYCKNPNALNITTVHDFTTEKYVGGIHRIIHSVQLKKALRHSQGVICVSENTKKDFESFFPWYKGTVVAIQNGYAQNDYYFENLDRTKDILFVGARTSYKRFDLAVRIAQALNDCRLVIVGGGELSPDEKAMLDRELPGRYEKKGFVSNNELRRLYNQAFFLCYSSEYEGFGIPLLEAQACGCPVVCQRKSSIPEVVADTAVYFDGSDLKEGIDRIRNLYDKQVYRDYQEKGIENAKRFSWKISAEKHQEFYRAIWAQYIKNED